ncbi:methyl-accepting chemotaxis protein [Hydrogenophaga luteola]|uniref:Methyl-accepting chemotaxis protein n=1 Tax=Hydrogenophaga luteola TaxID=1591122 RepID=A0ABV7W049_9BURK
MFSNLKVGIKLALGFGFVGLLIALIAGISWVKLEGAIALQNNALEDRYPKTVMIGDLKQDVTKQGVILRNALLATNRGDNAGVNAALAQLQESSAEVGKVYDKLEAVINNPKAKEMLGRIQDRRAAYIKERDVMLAMMREGKSAEAEQHLNGELQALRNAYDASMQEFLDFQRDLMDTAGDAARDSLASTLWAVEGLSLSAVVLAVLAALLITRAIVRPLNEAVGIADHIAAGDLTQKIEVQGRDETAQLLTAMSKMQQALRDLVTGVRQNAEGVATASAQIAQGNQDLSSRTEQQASALEETSASMEQMGSTAQQNADNARAASQLAASASNVAVQGGEVVSQVVSTMREIQHSSQKISDIIGVIDGIAFQTNILALNAAVEAARAGEQGRGFAVVAGEVRTLAQRSAEAAKEIKQLINASVERVEQGTTLVDRAGSTMQEVVQSIQRVTDIVGEISSASQEQNAGVNQVSEAVSNMDQTTQQNAALVEESASAAASLRQQADQLVKAVSVFRVHGGESSSAPAPVSKATPVAVHKPVAAPKPAATAKAPAPRPALQTPAKAQRPAPAAEPTPAPKTVTASAGASDDWESF